MGLQDYTGNSGDPTGPTGPSGPGAPSMGGMLADTDDVKAMLIDYNERFKDADPALFRDQLISQTMAVLISKGKPNPLFVGPAGVGKTRIAEEIARRIANDDPSVPKRLKKSTVYELPLSHLVAGAGIVGALEERMVALMDFLADPANNAVLFIDEIHQLTKSSGGHSSDPTLAKVGQILKPALARGDVRVIGSTTMQEARGFDHDPALKRRFTPVIVDELTREQTVVILEGARPGLQLHYTHQVLVADPVLEVAATVADEMSKADSHRPDGALTLLDRTMADIVVRHQAAVAAATAAQDTTMLAALQSLLPRRVSEDNLRDVALRLATGMATKQPFDAALARQELSRLRGQEHILEDVVDALDRESLSIFPRVQPIVWMFAGGSGIGKTETAKIVSRVLTQLPPIRLDMSEFGEKHDKSKILGAPPGYVGSDSNKELPFDSLESNPYRVILLDEFEKAAMEVKLLLLTAFDEGRMTMASGKSIDFSKCLIIATSNAAREAFNGRSIGFTTGGPQPEMSQRDIAQALKEAFPAELVGRFTKLVAYKPIDRDTYKEILAESYAREYERMLADHPRQAAHLPVQPSDEVLEQAVEESYVPDLGARPVDKTVRRLIEDLVIAGRTSPVLAASTSPAAAAPEEEPSHEEGDGSSDPEHEEADQAYAS